MYALPGRCWFRIMMIINDVRVPVPGQCYVGMGRIDSMDRGMTCALRPAVVP